MSFFGGLLDLGSYREGERNRKSQEEFAKHGLSWRVADANRAGIHPLAAIGFSGPSYQPQRTGQGDLAKDLIRTHYGKKLTGLESQMVTAQIEGIKANTALINARRLDLINERGQQDTTGGLGIEGQRSANGANIYTEPEGRIKSQHIGLEKTIAPTEFYGADIDGNIDNLLNQQSSEPAESDVYYRGKRFARQTWRHFKSLTGLITKPEPRQSAGKMHVWQWNNWQNNWQRVLKAKVIPLRSMKRKTMTKHGWKQRRKNKKWWQ